MGLDVTFLTGLYFKPASLPYSLMPYLPVRMREWFLGQLDASRRLGIANISQGDCFERNQVSDAANRP